MEIEKDAATSLGVVQLSSFRSFWPERGRSWTAFWASGSS